MWRIVTPEFAHEPQATSSVSLVITSDPGVLDRREHQAEPNDVLLRKMPRSGGTVARSPRRYSSAEMPDEPGCVPWTGWDSCIWSPISTTFRAQRPVATTLATLTWTAS